MKAAICPAFGGPEILEIGERPTPAIKESEVLVRVRAAGVNFADLVAIAGKYQLKSEPPFVPGMEIAGEITEVGANVKDWRAGDRVVALLDGGGYAEYAAVPASRLFRVPDALSFETAAATFINYTTAHVALHWRAQLQNGETCLVLGGAGGVGLASIALATRAGAKVIGAASSAGRCVLMKEHGAAETIDYGTSSLRDRVAKLTGKRGADVIIDPVGGEMGGLALRCIAWGGRIVTLGFPAGAIPNYPANILLVKNAAALGMIFGTYIDHAPDKVRQAVATIQTGLIDEDIRTYKIEQAHGLAKLPGLLKLVQERELTGKAVVTIQ
jgi:NADPH:quinone reductase